MPASVCRQALPKAEQQPETEAVQDPDRPTPLGVVVIPIQAPQPHTDTTALFQSSGLIRNKAALTAIGDSCGCMEYGYTRYLTHDYDRSDSSCHHLLLCFCLCQASWLLPQLPAACLMYSAVE